MVKPFLSKDPMGEYHSDQLFGYGVRLLASLKPSLSMDDNGDRSGG